MNYNEKTDVLCVQGYVKMRNNSQLYVRMGSRVCIEDKKFNRLLNTHCYIW